MRHLSAHLAALTLFSGVSLRRVYDERAAPEPDNPPEPVAPESPPVESRQVRRARERRETKR